MIKLFHLCSAALMHLYFQDVEVELYRADKVLQQAFNEDATARDFELAIQELPKFKRSLEGLLKSRNSKHARGLLRWVNMDIVRKENLFARLQQLRTKIESETMRK